MVPRCLETPPPITIHHAAQTAKAKWTSLLLLLLGWLATYNIRYVFSALLLLRSLPLFLLIRQNSKNSMMHDDYILQTFIYFLFFSIYLFYFFFIFFNYPTVATKNIRQCCRRRDRVFLSSKIALCSLLVYCCKFNAPPRPQPSAVIVINIP